jgi:ABC-2 type transport system permease protein
MTPTLALVTVSIRQALPTRRTALLLLAELGPAAVYLLATSNRTAIAAFDGLVEIGASTYFGLVLPVVTIVIAAGVLGNERRDTTLSFIVLRPMSRWGISVAKLLAGFLAAFAVNLVGALALGVTHAIRFGGPDIIVGLVIGGVVATLAYTSVVVPLGFLTDRAVIIGLAYLFIAENGVIFALSGLALLSPWRLGATVFADAVDGSRVILVDAIGTMTSANALMALLVYVVFGVVSTSYLLKRRDLA